MEAVKRFLAKLPRVAVVDLQGMIVSKGSPLGRGKAINLESARKQIDSAFKIKPVSVLLNINSPGYSTSSPDILQ